jgi:SAM-dependent methyltransferase
VSSVSRQGTVPELPPAAAVAHCLSAEEAAVFETAVVPRYLSLFGERLLAMLAGGSDARVCHVHCRTGYPDHALLERLPNAHVHGCDASESAVELARAKASALVQGGSAVVFDYRVADTFPLSFPAGAFSHAFTLHPLAPPAELRVLLQELARILAPHGQALIAMPLRGSFVEVVDLLREYAVKYELADLLNAVDAAAQQRPTDDMLTHEVESAGFEHVDVDVLARTLRFEGGRDFFEDPITRLLLMPELRLSLPLETSTHVVDPFAYVRDAIDKYWSDGTFELTVSIGVVSGRRRG